MKRIVLILTLLCAVMFTAKAQDTLFTQQPPAVRQKVAVVLSGGGAKGAAHVGALKVLERAGIPIDIITGTSMGSIIGGVYCCGHRASEIDSLLRAQDWSFVLSDREDLSHQTLPERLKQNTYALSRSLSFGKNVAPSGGGLVGGKNIVALFDALTAPYHDSISFNSLPIPFACVATDVVDNSEYVFHSGVLSQAIRASMAIPGVFAPVRLGGMVLVDGGLRNNYPADIARQMGADYIIGVDVSSEPKTANELNSTRNILMQVIDLNCKNKFEENQAISDVMIRVNTKGYSSASFSPAAIDTLIRRGEEAAMKQWDSIVALRKKLDLEHGGPSLRHSTTRVPLPVTARYAISEVHFQGMTHADETYVRTKYRLRPGDSIDANRADIIATAIRQDLYYKTATFRLYSSQADEHQAIVTFIAGEKRGSLLNIGARFDSEEMVALQLNAQLPLRTSALMDAELTLRLGKRLMARADWSLHPISFFRPTVTYVFRNNDIDLYEYGDKVLSTTYNLHSARLTVINLNTRNLNVSIGAHWNYIDYHSLLADHKKNYVIDDAQLEDKGYLSYEARVWYSNENDWYFPTRGVRLHGKFAYVTDNFVRLDNEVGIREYSFLGRINLPLTRRLSLQPMAYSRALYGSNVPLFMRNMMGGEWYGHCFEEQMPLAGVSHTEMAWDKLLGAQLQAQYNLTANNVLLLRFSTAFDAQEYNDLFRQKPVLGGSACYFYNSIFGPVGGSVGYSNLTKSLSYYINLGFVF